jgi:hypothetical protein
MYFYHLCQFDLILSCFSRQDNRQQEHESENQGTDKSFGRSRYRTRSSGTTIFGDNTMELNGDIFHLLITVSDIVLKIVNFGHITRKLIFKDKTLMREVSYV